ncbi:hypothetical protein GGI42DRAFT_337429 [Trichoderma sp. SZMC 28013]
MQFLINQATVTIALLLASLAHARPHQSEAHEGNSQNHLLFSKCTPGEWACNGNYDSIYNCNGSGKFVLSAQCGKPGCCHSVGTIEAFCYC